MNMFWFMAIAAFLAFLVKGIAGFASSLVYSSILSFRVDNIDISPVSLILNIPSNFIVAWQERKNVSYKLCATLASIMLLGNIVGIIWLKNGDTTVIKTIFGFFIVFLSIEMFLRERSTKKYKSSKILMFIVSLMAGVSSGLFGVGALVVAYISRTTTDMKSFKGTTCTVFLIDNFIRLGLYSYFGIMTFEVVKTALGLIPFVLAGTYLGMWLCKFVDEKKIKTIVTVLLFLSGLSLVFANLM